jgi:hypothetical protein
MFWSYLFMLLNPAILVVGLVIMAIYCCANAGLLPKKSSLTSSGAQDDDDNDDGSDNGGDGWESSDWDAPLDLPPGVFVLPPEPVLA